MKTIVFLFLMVFAVESYAQQCSMLFNGRSTDRKMMEEFLDELFDPRGPGVPGHLRVLDKKIDAIDLQLFKTSHSQKQYAVETGIIEILNAKKEVMFTESFIGVQYTVSGLNESVINFVRKNPDKVPEIATVKRYAVHFGSAVASPNVVLRCGKSLLLVGNII